MEGLTQFIIPGLRIRHNVGLCEGCHLRKAAGGGGGGGCDGGWGMVWAGTAPRKAGCRAVWCNPREGWAFSVVDKGSSAHMDSMSLGSAV